MISDTQFPLSRKISIFPVRSCNYFQSINKLQTHWDPPFSLIMVQKARILLKTLQTFGSKLSTSIYTVLKYPLQTNSGRLLNNSGSRSGNHPSKSSIILNNNTYISRHYRTFFQRRWSSWPEHQYLEAFRSRIHMPLP